MSIGTYEWLAGRFEFYDMMIEEGTDAKKIEMGRN